MKALQNSTMKALIFSLFLLVGCGGNFSQKTVPQQSIAARSGVVFFGDSIFNFWNLDGYFPGKGYVNAGRYGLRTDQMVPLMADTISGKNVCHGLAGSTELPLTCETIPPPDTIIIFAGMNNLLQGNMANALSDIQTMVQEAQASGVHVIVCTVYAYDAAYGTTNFDAARIPLNAGIAKLPNVEVVDFSALFALESDYTSDGIHPNDSGYVQMAPVTGAAIAQLQ